MKVLDVSSVHEGIRGMTQQLSQLEKQLNGVENSIRSFVASKDSFRGKGANAIRRFYEYAHLPFLQFFQSFLTNFQSKLQQLQLEMAGLEGDSRGFIDESFLSSELEDGLNQINRMVAELTGETNTQLSRISDILYLPRLQDHQFHEGIQQAKQSARQTMDKLHQFDHQQTQSFTALIEDLTLIKRYIEEMNQQFESGKINVKSFLPVMLQDLEAYRELQTRLYNQTVMERWNSQHYPELGVFYSVGHAASFDQWVNPSCARPEAKIRSLDEVALDFSLGLRDGALKFLKETKDGILRLVTEPEVILQETVAFAGEVVNNPAIIGEIAKELYQTFDTMVIHGDAESRGEWFGYALPTVGSIFVGGTGAVKGAGKVIQVGRKTQTDLEIKLNDKKDNPEPIAIGPPKKSMDRVRELINDLAHRRDLELAPVMASDVPFNAFNSAGIKISLNRLYSQSFTKIETIGYGGKSYGANKHIPSVRNKEFNKWFDNISADEFEEMWNVPHLRSKIEDRIRQPGGYHEWHLVARTPKFKQWGVSMDDIKELRTLTKDVVFVNPSGRHGGRGSTKAHNEILKIIDTAPDYESFVRELNVWASKRMKNGILDLPEGLRR